MNREITQSNGVNMTGNQVSQKCEEQHEGLTTKTIEMMDKTEAQEKDRLLVALADEFVSEAGAIALEIKVRQGWRALGFNSWADYCANVDQRVSRMFAERAATKALVEKNIAKRVPLTHALQLARITDPEGQREVYAKVTKTFAKPIALNYETAVETWLIDHKQSTRLPGQRGGHWVASDLEDDPELAEAFDKIQEVYGLADRKAFQDGTIGWTSKDIIGLANFQVSKMKEVHYLIMETHWNLARCFKFLNKTVDLKTSIQDLIHHGLGTPGLRFTCSIGGWDISATACKALEKNLL